MEEAMNAAILAVQHGSSIRASAIEIGVPHATLHRRLNQTDPFKSKKGPASVLKDHEEVLVDWIKDCARKGFPQRKGDILDSVQDTVKELHLDTPFQENRPGRGWYAEFLKRHPDLTERCPEAVTRASANVSEQNIRGWFKSVEDVLAEEGLLEVLKDPRRVFNGDETNFLLCPEGKKVIVPKGIKNAYEVDRGQAKSAITCMFTFSADGNFVHPMLIYPYKRIPKEILTSVPKNWGIGRSDSGWMKSETFYEYVGNVFNTYLEEHQIPRPVVLFIDGHKSHLTIQTSKLCKELDIVLVALYPNATRILQPADVSAFRPIKSRWQDGVREWRRSNLHDSLNREHVAPILNEVLKSPMGEILRKGFRATELFPWNPDAIDYFKCLGKNQSADEELPAQSVNATREKTLSYESFVNIVGEENIKLFKAMDAEGQQANTSKEASANQLLYALWRKIEHLPSNFERNVTDNPENHSLEQEASTSKSSDPAKYAGTENGNLPQKGCSSSSGSTKSASQCLQWPKSPERKGRQIKKMPFVLTSAQWQSMKEETEAKRQSEEGGKQERKRKREENKRQKEEEESRQKKERQNSQNKMRRRKMVSNVNAPKNKKSRRRKRENRRRRKREIRRKRYKAHKEK